MLDREAFLKDLICVRQRLKLAKGKEALDKTKVYWRGVLYGLFSASAKIISAEEFRELHNSKTSIDLVDSLITILQDHEKMEEASMSKFKKLGLTNCHDCDISPGQPHEDGCDTERCSVCAGQRMCCDCEGHNKYFAKWTGIFPGRAESEFLNMDLNEFHAQGLTEIFWKEKP